MRPYININLDLKGNNVVISKVENSKHINVSIDTAIYGNATPYMFKGFQLSPDKNTIINTLEGNNTGYALKGYQGYISQQVYTGEEANVSLQFQVQAINPKAQISIVFDLATNEYCTDFTISNNQNSNVINVTNNNSTLYIFAVKDLQITTGAIITLTMKKWSKLNRSFTVTSISTSAILEFNSKDIIKFTCSENLMDSDLSVQPGICEQYANIQLYDRQNILHMLALQGVLNKNEEITIYMIDNIGTKHILGVYYVEQWDIYNDKSCIDIICRDKSYLLEKIDIVRSEVANRTLDDLINILFSQAPGVSWEYCDSETATRCKQIFIPDSWYLASNLQEMLEKICSIGMLRIYWYVNSFKIGRCV